MPDFYEVHRAAIERLLPFAEHTGDMLRVVAWEPHPSDAFTIVTFRCTRNGYEPATPDDNRAIADWNKRHGSAADAEKKR